MGWLSSTAGSALDTLGSWVGAEIQGHYGRKNAEFLNQLAISSAKDLALNQPTWKRQGYEDAGFNPILAINDGSFAQPVTTNMPMPDTQHGDMLSAPAQSALGAVGSAVGLASMITNLQKDRSNLAAIKEENQARIEKARLEKNVFSARNSAFYMAGGAPLEGDGKSVSVPNMEHISNIRKGELDRESLLSERYLRDTLKYILDSGQDASSVIGNLLKGAKK